MIKKQWVSGKRTHITNVRMPERQSSLESLIPIALHSAPRSFAGNSSGGVRHEKRGQGNEGGGEGLG